MAEQNNIPIEKPLQTGTTKKIWINSYMFIINLDFHPGTGFIQIKNLIHFMIVDTIITEKNSIIAKTGTIIFQVT